MSYSYFPFKFIALAFNVNNMSILNINNIVITFYFLGSPAHPLLSLALSYPEEQGGDKDANQDISSVRLLFFFLLCVHSPGFRGQLLVSCNFDDKCCNFFAALFE